MKIFDKVFGVGQTKIESMTKEKPIDSAQVRYMRGHKTYPEAKWSYVYFYEDRFEIEEYQLVVPYNKIKDVGNTNGKQRDSDRLAIGIIALPLALAYLWKKDYTYTIIEYDDENDIQKIVLDFHKNLNYAQALIYKKMLECRKKPTS